jgi:3-dehydroquinate synthase
VTEPVLVRQGALASLGALAAERVRAHRWVVISDDTVAALYADRVVRSFGDARVDVIAVPPGEAHKTRATWAEVTDRMLALGLGRDAAVVALGGGVVGDLAGFVAATFMRGIPVVQAPTTLLAMIDASIGGKTAVDTPAGKNLVGAFHAPALVVVDPDTLGTLPDAALRAGLAEALKHGVVADAEYFARLERDLPALVAPGGHRSEAMASLIARSITIKQDVVRRDAREDGVRKTLNFGHTIGHAVEALSAYRLLHGEAVAIGMALESRLAERIGVARHGTAARITTALERAGLPTSRPADQAPDAVLAATRSDKKARAGAVEYALPARVGEMAGAGSGWSVRVPDEAVAAVLA